MNEPNNQITLAPLFTNYAVSRLRDCFEQIERCAILLTVDQIWHRPNEVSNAVGNLVLHLTGNVRQWIVAGIGGEQFDRDRPAEFSRREPVATDVILAELRATVEKACRVIEVLGVEELSRNYSIQGYDVHGLDAVFHVVEHFSLHTGQIVYATKLLINRDLSLYDPQGRRIDGRDDGAP